jgi:exonuclease VII large subunit
MCNFRPMLVGALLCIATPAAAADVVMCPLEEAMQRLEHSNVKIREERGQQLLPLLEELQQLVTKSKDPNLPTGLQLSSADRNRLQAIRLERLVSEMSLFETSGYLRDARVIAQAAKVARDMSEGRKFKENDPQFFYASVVGRLALQQGEPKLEVTTPSDTECTVDAGLHFYEQLKLKSVNNQANNFLEANSRLDDVSRKYKIDRKQDQWVEQIPSLPEKQQARIDWAVVQKGFDSLQYVINIENLKALNRVSIRIYRADMDEINRSRSEEELGQFRKAWDQELERADERTKMLAAILNLIAQKIPSDARIEAERRQQTLQQEGGIR